MHCHFDQREKSFSDPSHSLGMTGSPVTWRLARANSCFGCRMLINACRPFTWRDQFPKSNVFSSEERKIVENKWRDLLEAAGRKRSPWSGVQ
jgi:hypothetical protein